MIPETISPGIDPGHRERAIRLARRWIVQSEIQSTDHRPAIHGAFHAWFDPDTARFRYMYPEITGYGITTLLYLDSLRRDAQLLPRACLAGNWMLQHALDAASGGVPPPDYYERRNRDDRFLPNRHFLMTFDSGMVLCGLALLYERTKHSLYLEGARRVADFLIGQAQKRNGLMYPCFEQATQRWTDTAKKWSTQSGSYHAKVSLGLLHLYRLTRFGKYQTAAERVCRAALRLQLPSGRFVTYRNGPGSGPNGGATHMHPHLYSAEGLLVTGLAMNRPEFVRSAVRAVRWALGQQLPDGGLPCLVGPEHQCNVNQRSDTLAQALRLGALCYGLGELPASAMAKLARLERKLLTYQHASPVPSNEQHMAGGFYYGCDADSSRRRHINFWCTAFALQALIMYRDIVFDGRAPKLDYLI